jgi:prepilin peptidase CpaA
MMFKALALVNLLLAVNMIAIWAALSDVKQMRIPNAAVLTLILSYLLLGPAIFPLADWGRGWLIGLITLAIGFGLTRIGAIGAGDAKYAAAMAPFFIGVDPFRLIMLFMICLVSAYLLHRLLRRVGALRRRTPEWQSWDHAKFPMGLVLSLVLIIQSIRLSARLVSMISP